MSEKKVKIPEIISVGEFAGRLGVPTAQVITELMKNGVMATINENIDYETAEIIAEFLGFEVEKEETLKKVESKIDTESKNIAPRPPVIAVLGHVDHGKTSLLDQIRKTDIASGESGGITQHIGAYQVEKEGQKITFLDTPGHEAFEKMRKHGAKITDIVILVVAADDGIKPQTVEAIKHIKEAETQMIVAINKIDKPGADSTRTRQDLMKKDVTPQEWGGDIEFVDVSAKTGEGIDKLLETIVALSEVMDLRADPTVAAQGLVIESDIKPGKGPVATVLVQNGTLQIGDYIQAGEAFGKVKSMEDEHKNQIKKALPSDAVRVSGLREVPNTAEFVQAFASEKESKREADRTREHLRIRRKGDVKKISPEGLSEDIKRSKKEELSLIVKADVVGSLGAVKESLLKLNNDYVAIKFVNEGVGEISETDLAMAEIADKIVVGFRAKASPNIIRAAKTKGIKLINHDVIYELIDDVKEIMAEKMPIERIENEIGNLKVLAVFKVSPKKTVVGGKIEKGKVEKGARARLKRKKDIIGDYEVKTVQKGMKNVDACVAGEECGISFAEKIKFEVGDLIDFYTVSEKRREL